MTVGGWPQSTLLLTLSPLSDGTQSEVAGHWTRMNLAASSRHVKLHSELSRYLPSTAANVSVCQCTPVASNQANVHFGWLATTLADAEGLFNEGVFEAKPGRFL
jgi:hypothetical protein